MQFFIGVAVGAFAMLVGIVGLILYSAHLEHRQKQKEKDFYNHTK